MKNRAWVVLWALAFLVQMADARSGDYDFINEERGRAGYEIDSENKESIVIAWSRTQSPIDGGHTVWLYEIASGCGSGTKSYADLSEEAISDDQKNEIYVRCLITSGAVQ